MNNYIAHLATMKQQARLEYAAHRQFCLLTGEAGMGKSTAVRSLVQKLDHYKYRYLYLCDSRLTPKLFYRSFTKLWNSPCISINRSETTVPIFNVRYL
ncbi:ATP-binding protein [Anaerobacillus sp. HL2]|nr:ATP-binding protein [Anaerobacillus sp. HL2]